MKISVFSFTFHDKIKSAFIQTVQINMINAIKIVNKVVNSFEIEKMRVKVPLKNY